MAATATGAGEEAPATGWQTRGQRKRASTHTTRETHTTHATHTYTHTYTYILSR